GGRHERDEDGNRQRRAATGRRWRQHRRQSGRLARSRSTAWGERCPGNRAARKDTATRRPASGRPPRATTPAGASGGRKLHGTHRDMLIPRVLLGPAPIGRTINQKTVALLQAAGKMARFTAGSWIRSADPSAEDHDDGTDLLLGSRRARAGRPNGRLGPIAQGHAARPLPSPPRARAPPGDDERKSTHGVKSRDGTHLPR
ncbi:unnamed protein product, partial [Prorocentrum cordatum]